ncbi:MAG: sugar transferase [Blastocatellia bacterium]|nr:sugar transferase [Blastocatellia bacterium]
MEKSENIIDITTRTNTPTHLLALARYLKYEAILLPICTSLIILWDIAVVVMSFILAYWFRLSEPVFYAPQGTIIGFTDNFQPYSSVLLFIPIVRIIALRHYDLYRLRGEFSILQDLSNIFKATMVSSLVITSIAFLYRGGVEFRDFSYSRLVFVYDWVLVFGATILTRLFVRIVQIVYRRHSVNLIPTIVVGCGKNAEVCVAEMSESRRLGYKVLGVLSTNAAGETVPTQLEGVPVLGTFEDLPALVRQFGIREVIITDERISPDTIFESVLRCGRKHHVEFRVVPNMFNCLPNKTGVDQIGSLPMIKLFQEPLQGPNRWLKRSIDVSLSLLGLVLTAPLWFFVILAIRLTSSGPALYTQERVGMDGRVFRAYKFRSMYYKTDDRMHREMMRRNINNENGSNQGDEEQPVYGKVKDDPRITPIGGFIRRYSLDELPQLLNVVKGEMSLIGPRPPIPYEVELYKEWHRARFHVKPGITGLWQVSGRNRLNFEQMVKLDIYYIENWSLWLDLKILLKTFPVVLKGDNAY